ncbi:zinc-binding metallopeptidase family protein [Neolewinella antarctica]|uniref:Zinc-ribbon domain-containing protein n=1 Tax=Neolewinella antarctica TaxID=442734 RepID=A0ABX0XAV9_9BACT|nr:putative zinc-binding peptidase [Neolewinella antarctica]NJC26370.1 hypothetical protein [Neolewinella antarctica]
MKIYQCGNCQHPVYFANTSCERCKSWLGYLPETDEMIALSPGGTVWDAPASATAGLRYCANHQHGVCNWLLPTERKENLCESCDLNNVIPNLSDPSHLPEWRKLERAKHRLVYALRRLKLPLESQMGGKRLPLAFDFLSEDDATEPVMTGHDSGLITINTNEANSVHREATRIQMQERYRTLIGHFRHEVGHYYWDVLVSENPAALAGFRELFGDDREDYQAALEKHYRNGSPPNWRDNYISEYATTHAWEDWAETWAHYLHLLDMLETANAFGMRTDPALVPDGMMTMHATFDPYEETDFNRIINACIPLTLAVNTLNRGMGRKDLYPFVINQSVRKKLVYVHELLRQSQVQGVW